jgi:hypothetical protein
MLLHIWRQAEQRADQMPKHPEETSQSTEHPSDLVEGGVSARLKRRWTAFTRAGVKEIISEVLVRFLVGLALGGIACFLLIPAIFWPRSRHNPHPIFDEISDVSWAKWFFAAVLFLPAIIGALTTLLDDPRAGFWSALGLKRRAVRHQITDGVMIVEEDNQPASWLGRFLCKVGNFLAWIALCAPGLLIILYGRHVILVERITSGKYQKTTTYGLEAVGWGWIFVGLGIVVLGECLEIKSERGVFRLLGWVLGVAATVYGVTYFF